LNLIMWKSVSSPSRGLLYPSLGICNHFLIFHIMCSCLWMSLSLISGSWRRKRKKWREEATGHWSFKASWKPLQLGEGWNTGRQTTMSPGLPVCTFLIRSSN
jgi:hypothetical protein